MQLSEIQDLKYEAEQKIGEILLDFTEMTGLSIQDVFIKTTEIGTHLENSAMVSRIVKLKIEL